MSNEVVRCCGHCQFIDYDNGDRFGDEGYFFCSIGSEKIPMPLHQHSWRIADKCPLFEPMESNLRPCPDLVDVQEYDEALILAWLLWMSFLCSFVDYGLDKPIAIKVIDKMSLIESLSDHDMSIDLAVEEIIDDMKSHGVFD